MSLSCSASEVPIAEVAVSANEVSTEPALSSGAAGYRGGRSHNLMFIKKSAVTTSAGNMPRIIQECRSRRIHCRARTAGAITWMMPDACGRQCRFSHSSAAGGDGVDMRHKEAPSRIADWNAVQLAICARAPFEVAGHADGWYVPDRRRAAEYVEQLR